MRRAGSTPVTRTKAKGLPLWQSFCFVAGTARTLAQKNRELLQNKAARGKKRRLGGGSSVLGEAEDNDHLSPRVLRTALVAVLLLCS